MVDALLDASLGASLEASFASMLMGAGEGSVAVEITRPGIVVRNTVPGIYGRNKACELFVFLKGDITLSLKDRC